MTEQNQWVEEHSACVRRGSDQALFDFLHSPWRSYGVCMGEWIGSRWHEFVLTPKQIGERAMPPHEALTYSGDPANLGTPGHYFLMINRRVVYVGMSRQCVFDRIHKHTCDKAFMQVSVSALPWWPQNALRQIEAVYIDLFKPLYNKQPEDKKTPAKI